MKSTIKKTTLLNKFFNTCKYTVLFILMISSFFNYPNQVSSLEVRNGEAIYIKHCSGCHVNGGNIVRRNKTLKQKDLERNGLDSPKAIARIAAKGIGIMSGYEEVLDEKEDEILANWIWEQSQKAWVQE